MANFFLKTFSCTTLLTRSTFQLEPGVAHGQLFLKKFSLRHPRHSVLTHGGANHTFEKNVDQFFVAQVRGGAWPTFFPCATPDQVNFSACTRPSLGMAHGKVSENFVVGCTTGVVVHGQLLLENFPVRQPHDEVNFFSLHQGWCTSRNFVHAPLRSVPWSTQQNHHSGRVWCTENFWAKPWLGPRVGVVHGRNFFQTGWPCTNPLLGGANFECHR